VFHLKVESIVIVALLLVMIFGGMKLPGLRETFLQDREPRPPDGRRSRVDWFVVGVAAVFGVVMLLLLSYVPRR
jgi:hypothetical protein